MNKEEQVADVVTRAQALIDKMNVVTQSDEWANVWSLAFTHGVQTKLNWGKEFEALQSALKQLREPKHEHV